MKKIFTGNDRARELGFSSYREMVKVMSVRSGKPWNGKVNLEAPPYYAYIDSGRWGWTCKCGNPHYAEPSDPIAYCIVCGNVADGGFALRVIFPENRTEIEEALLEREMIEPAGIDLGTQTIFLPAVKPVKKGCYRSWKPGESVKDLKNQYKKAGKNGS